MGRSRPPDDANVLPFLAFAMTAPLAAVGMVGCAVAVGSSAAGPALLVAGALTILAAVGLAAGIAVDLTGEPPPPARQGLSERERCRGGRGR